MNKPKFGSVDYRETQINGCLIFNSMLNLCLLQLKSNMCEPYLVVSKIYVKNRQDQVTATTINLWWMKLLNRHKIMVGLLEGLRWFLGANLKIENFSACF